LFSRDPDESSEPEDGTAFVPPESVAATSAYSPYPNVRHFVPSNSMIDILDLHRLHAFYLNKMTGDQSQMDRKFYPTPTTIPTMIARTEMK
jgi:hypothetical protein